MAENEAPKKVEEAAPVPVAPLTPAIIRKDLVAELELLSDRALGKLTGYARQGLAAIGSMLDGFEDADQKPPAKDVPTKTKG